MPRHGGMALYALAVAACSAAAAQPRASSPSGPHQELLAALAAARARGCTGRTGTDERLRPVARLDEAARRIARGESAREALAKSGYRAVRVYQVSISGARLPGAAAQALAQGHCAPLTDPGLTEAGAYNQGTSWWVVLAAPFAPPAPAAAPAVAERVLALINQARSQPRRCGDTSFQAAPPVGPNPLLAQAAAAHAQDMAAHDYLEHRGRDGSGPAERVSRAGYRWRSVGENIASGQTTPEQVVREWLRSPGHCATLMNPGFTEMGVAFRVNAGSEGGIYWAQEFGRPR